LFSKRFINLVGICHFAIKLSVWQHSCALQKEAGIWQGSA